MGTYDNSSGHARYNPEEDKVIDFDNNTCDFCKSIDSAINPVHPIINADEYDTHFKVCSKCVSEYDGTFSRNENGDIIYI